MAALTSRHGPGQTDRGVFYLMGLPRELRDMVYEQILDLYPKLIVRKHRQDKTYEPNAAFRARRQTVVAGLEFNKGLHVLSALLQAKEPISTEFMEAIHEVLPHHVDCELRDPVYGWNPPCGTAFGIGHEEVEFASKAADLHVYLTFTGDLSYKPFIDTTVFDDVRKLLARCDKAKTITLFSKFRMKVPKEDKSTDLNDLRRDRDRLFWRHVVPVIESQSKLTAIFAAFRIVFYELLDSGEYGGKWKQPGTMYEKRGPSMSWDDHRVQRFIMQEAVDDQGDDVIIKDNQNMHLLEVIALERLVWRQMGYRFLI